MGEIIFGDHSEASLPRCISQETLHILPRLQCQQRHAQPIDRTEETLNLKNWNPGPRRGKEGAIEKQIARKVAHHHSARSI